MVSLYGGHSPRHCDVLQQILETLTGAMADEDGGDKGRRLSGCCTRAGLCSPQGPLGAALVEVRQDASPVCSFSGLFRLPTVCESLNHDPELGMLPRVLRMARISNILMDITRRELISI